MRRLSQTPLGIRDFRLLWLGETISSLGDQFAMIALPWLALMLTGSALALGSVLALMGIPRVVLMLVGGVYVDRLSPRRVMIASNAVRLLAVTALGGLVLVGQAQLWTLYAFAFIFGVADAFFLPAINSMVPALVTRERLQQANGIVTGTSQLTALVGPALAGVIVAGFGTTGGGAGQAGIAVALLIDGATFLASLGALMLIRGGSTRSTNHQTVFSAIGEALSFVWRAPSMRFTVLLFMAMNVLVVGPYVVGVPMIAYTRLPGGASAFGTLMSAIAGGGLLGTVLATTLPGPRPARFGSAVMAIMALTGLGMVSLAVFTSLPPLLCTMAVMGATSSYGGLLIYTWIQQRIPPELMGRVLSVVSVGCGGLIPVSQVVAGAAVQLSLTGMLIISGGTMTLIAFASIGSRTIRRMGLVPTSGEQ